MRHTQTEQAVPSSFGICLQQCSMVCNLKHRIECLKIFDRNIVETANSALRVLGLGVKPK